MRWLPWFLVLARAGLAPVLIVLAFAGARGVLVACIVFALVGDVADGKIARRLGIATDRLRKADSLADLVFWLATLGAAWVLEPDELSRHAGWIAALLLLEAALHAVSWLRFGQGPANHAYASKTWGLLLCASLVAIVGWGVFGPLFWATIAVGLVAQLDGVLIVALLPEWRRDVPSFWQALAARRGA